MEDALDRLVRFNELGKVEGRATPTILDELVAMSLATIDRYLKLHEDAQHPSHSQLRNPQYGPGVSD